MEELISQRGDPGKNAPTGGGKRSVHTKFELSREALEALETLTAHWGTSQKEVAEMAIQLTISFLTDEDPETRERFVEKAREQPGDRTRETHVVSRETKSFLEATAEDLDLTRDQFFDACLRLSHTIVQFLRDTQLERHEALLPALRKLLQQATSIEEDLREAATNLDPLKPALTAVRRRLSAIVEDVEAEVEQGRPLDRGHEFTEE